jgi:hypothetical protein
MKTIEFTEKEIDDLKRYISNFSLYYEKKRLQRCLEFQ